MSVIQPPQTYLDENGWPISKSCYELQQMQGLNTLVQCPRCGSILKLGEMKLFPSDQECPICGRPL